MKNYKKQWGYNVTKTKFPGIYKKMEGGYVARARVQTPTGHQKEILKSGDWSTEIEALQWLADEKDKIKTGIQAPQEQLFSVYAVNLLERKLSRREIKSAAGESKWRVSLTHLIGGTVKEGHPPVLGFGDLCVSQMRPSNIETWKDQIAPLIAGGTYSPVTINGWLTILRVISRAASREYEIRDFMAGVEDFSTSDHHTYTEEAPNSLRPEDVPRFLALMKERHPQHYAFVLLGFVTGLRPSTIRPLRRSGPESDILWDEGRMLIRRSEVNGDVLNVTKTGIRYSVHLPPEVMDVLRWHNETQFSLAQEASDLLFPSDIGGFKAGSFLKKPFADVCDAMGLTFRLTPRGMRRTFQDVARAAQVQDLVTRSVSGHSTDQMQRHYSTVSGSEQRESLGRVFQVIQGGGGKSGGMASQSGGKIEKASQGASLTG